MDQDLLRRPADELAGLVRDGEVTARELTELSLAALEADPYGAVVDVLADTALAAAGGIAAGDARPLAGVPVAVKNNRAVQGARLTQASGFMGDFVPSYDHHVTARLKAAGAVVVATTTLPEFGILPTTETRRFGATRNPWDPARTPGGSSGGSAAAVAGGLVPLAHGNDGGGSTRIPAACTGLVGLKPQRGRISLAPEIGSQFLVQDGVLTRTVRETALGLDLLAGYVEGDLAWAPPPDEPFAVAAAREPGRLRVAVTTLPPIAEAVVDPEVVAAVQDTARLLEALGHDVVEADPPWQVPGVDDLFRAVFGPAVCTTVAFAGLLAGREPGPDDVEPLTWWLWEQCRELSSTYALGAEFQLHGFARHLLTWLAGFDVLLTPALAERPVPLGTLDPQAPDAEATFRRSAAFTPFTPIFNVTGSPAISLPLHSFADGLPLAVQLCGRPAREGQLLALATQLEAARPWHDRRPPAPAAA